MNWRKHMVLVIGGGVALLLMILALIFLLRAKGEYSRVNDELENSMRRLESLSRRTPFPSPDNVRRMEENLEALREKASEIQAFLQKGQVPQESIEAAEFPPLLERVIARIKQRAAESGVLLPEQLNLGLARYLAGELPSNEAIPRLVIQVNTMAALCNLLFQSRIQSLVGMDRQAFELAATPTADEPVVVRRRVAVDAPTVTQSQLPPVAENPLFEVERITVVFTARDAVIWDVLNLLARSPLIAAVVDVQLANTISDKIGKAQPVAPIGGDQPGMASITRYPTHEERVVAGRELVQATMVVDVYRFVRDLKEDAP